MAIPILSVKDMNVSFGSTKAVDNVSFDLEKGKVLGIVGESGSGKSMTALSIMGLLPYAKNLKFSGTIEYFNSSKTVDLVNISEKKLNKIRGNEISMIFQDPLSALNPTMKCGEQAVEPIRCHLKKSKKDAEKIILNIFEKVKIQNVKKVFNSYPHELSGGQRQRVMIAMAMSTNPRILIADEPTTALDVTVQKGIINLIKDLQLEFGMSVIFISHDLALVKMLADDVLVMNKGKIVESGATDAVFSSPTHYYTKALIACRPKLGVNPERLKTINDFIENKIATSPIIAQKKCDFQEKVLSVENLNVVFKIGKNRNTAWLKANDNISFSLFKGETLGLIGESGCGKSTLIRAILQLIKPTSGKVLFDNMDLTEISKRKMRSLRTRLQIVFQDPYSSLTPSLTVQDALIEPMKEHGVFKNKKERIDYIVYVLEKTGLSSDDLKKYPHQFSGGQRQRIVISRALVLKPEIVFCDESVSALDVSVQAQVLNLLNDLKNEFNLTYVFISHDMNVVNYMSDRIMVMHNGKIVESGLAHEIINNPQKDYTKTLIEAIPTM